MNERLTDKACEPSRQDIENYLGSDALPLLEQLELWLRSRYDLSRELRFPFGTSYGWGYKYSHKKAHLCYAFFESGAFTITLQIGDARVPAMEKQLQRLQPATQKLWENRYPCGTVGGCVHLRVDSPEALNDARILIEVRKPGISEAK